MLFRRSMQPKKAIKMSFQESKRGRGRDCVSERQRQRHLQLRNHWIDKFGATVKGFTTPAVVTYTSKTTATATLTTAAAEKKTKCAIHCGFTFIRNVQAQRSGSPILSAPTNSQVASSSFSFSCISYSYSPIIANE